jgi:hypothetical protein
MELNMEIGDILKVVKSRLDIGATNQTSWLVKITHKHSDDVLYVQIVKSNKETDVGQFWYFCKDELETVSKHMSFVATVKKAHYCPNCSIPLYLKKAEGLLYSTESFEVYKCPKCHYCE